MLTPIFELKQTDRDLIIIIKVPHAQISDAEVFIEECDFKFYAKPYYLRLTLPGAVVEDGSETAKYDFDTGVFTIKVRKAKQGESFEGLDLLTKLLAPSKPATIHQPSVEVLSESELKVLINVQTVGGVQDELDNEDEEEFDWQIEQIPYTEPELSADGPMYGFANQKSAVFSRLQSELHDIIDLEEADSTPWQNRKPMREASENTKFDEDYYMADFVDDDVIKQLLDFKPEWQEEIDLLKSGKNPDTIIEINDEEREKMLKLPKREYILDANSQQIALLSLVDIIFAYVFNHMSTEGENMVESGWNICKLSSTLSWLEVPNNIHEVIRSNYRRTFCYPLQRHWKLTEKVFTEVCNVFLLGRKRILKCLLETHSILNGYEQRYILNDLYITDYCVWIQIVGKKHLDSLSKYLSQIEMKKSEVGFELASLEEAALLEHEETSSQQLTEEFASIHLTDSQDHCHDDSDSHNNKTTKNFESDLDLASSTDSETDTNAESESDESESEESTESETDCSTNFEGNMSVKSGKEKVAVDETILHEHKTDDTILHENKIDSRSLNF